MSSRILVAGRRRYIAVNSEPPAPPSDLIGVGSASDSLVTYPPTGPVTSGRWYVDAADGSDTGSGDFSHPFATIPKALAEAAANDVILVRGGTYARSEAIVVNKAVKLWAYGDERPRIDRGMGGSASGEVAFAFRLTAATAHLKGFEIVGVPANASQPDNSQAVRMTANGCIVEDVIAHSGATGCIYGSDVDDCIIMDCVSFACAGAGSGSNRPDCFAFTGPKSPVSPADNCRIVRCVAANGTDDCYDLFVAENTQIIDCVAFGAGYDYRDGTVPSPGDGNGFKLGGETVGGSNHNTIRGCIAIGCYQQGISQNSSWGDGNVYVWCTSILNAYGLLQDTGGTPELTANNVIVGNATYDNNVLVGPNRNNTIGQPSLPLATALFADANAGDFSLLPDSPGVGTADGGDNRGASEIALALAKRWYPHGRIYVRGRGWGPGGTGLPGDI